MWTNGSAVLKSAARQMSDSNAVTQAMKLPTLLEGEALTVWLELSDEDKAYYSKAKNANYCRQRFQC